MKKEDVKKKIVGHWGTVPGQNFVYAHLNRVINKYDLDLLLISGPGHGGNFFVANSYLEGRYSEVYPNVSEDIEGLKKLDNPNLIATVIVGDGEAETGPLATSWQGNKFINPKGDGAVLPILHLNGYKIANPTIFARMSHDEIKNFFNGCGYEPIFVEGSDPMTMHQLKVPLEHIRFQL